MKEIKYRHLKTSIFSAQPCLCNKGHFLQTCFSHQQLWIALLVLPWVNRRISPFHHLWPVFVPVPHYSKKPLQVRALQSAHLSLTTPFFPGKASPAARYSQRSNLPLPFKGLHLTEKTCSYQWRNFIAYSMNTKTSFTRYLASLSYLSHTEWQNVHGGFLHVPSACKKIGWSHQHTHGELASWINRDKKKTVPLPALLWTYMTFAQTARTVPSWSSPPGNRDWSSLMACTPWPTGAGSRHKSPQCSPSCTSCWDSKPLHCPLVRLAWSSQVFPNTLKKEHAHTHKMVTERI